MTLRTLILRYTAFAVVATIANLAMQRAILEFGDSDFHFASAIAAGTIVGLVIKYLLDKRWIFYDIEKGVINHGRKFSLYAAMGIMTTALFWGTETAFWLIWKTDAMREFGAVIGLSIGYIFKYKLDRSFVFANRQLAEPT